MNRLCTLLLATWVTLCPVVLAETSLDALMLKGLTARSIGPAAMGGRVSDLALDPKDPFTFYVGLGTGGLMKTSDNGGSFQGVFEQESVAAVGAVAVAPSDPKVIWVGTGEANDRNSSSWGHGVFRSTDGAATWTNVGLTQSKTIARIVIHPKDPNTAWVAASGDLWGPSPERGLYKTTDGGKTWKVVLSAPAPYTNRVGATDVALDPSNPNILYAALYARERKPWAFSAGPEATDGKDLGGIFKSSDGGTTWSKLTEGLPTDTGRIGLAVYPKNPKILYAVVQSDSAGTSTIDDIKSKRGGVFRSEDGGTHWTRVNALNPRPFYFSQIRVDPQNDQRIYVLGFALHISEDGGKTFREDRFKNVHPDNHALAIDPNHPQRILLGNDGGLYQSYNAGAQWEHLNRIAAGEFYRINVDMGTPYRVCGGLQDNLNWIGPSLTRTKEGILNSDWTNIGGGDGFYCLFDQEDPKLVFAESQQGFVHRLNLQTGEFKDLRPEPAEGQPAFRFHWNAPLIPSLHTPRAMYLAGNRVFKLTERGAQWRVISPDLSTQDPQKTTTAGSGAENYGVVYTLAESPLKPGLLWAGTDDGKVWLTPDEGKSWTDLTPNLPASIQGQWMSRIEASHHDPQVAYLAVDAHRAGIYKPLAYRTADGGKTWQDISADLPPDHPVKVLREDLKNPNLLYAGTEFALWVSLDRGGHWIKFGGLPTVAVDDLVIHPRDLDLVIATHGRSLYVLDDLRPLEELTPAVQAKAVYLFTPRPAYGFYPLPGFKDSNGSAVFRGENPPTGALLSFYVKSFTGEPVDLAITNAQGQPVANLSAPGTPGLQRVTWDLKPTKDLLTEYGGEGQKFVKSGEYTITLTYGKTTQTQKLQVAIAPGIETR
ncbi:WD40/YVTN/BNR-like repeat-containing protein [Anthocerotibacter panamensis]|uniref:WD40/YVTN/BNR-like repeat-containing protein n=1 Tax=Anthocerotibacter panamensis TaxID=2857077 RepID=UPI001C404F27|nr:sialidase family protein [Anthocerotibacter panamensis]